MPGLQQETVTRYWIRCNGCGAETVPDETQGTAVDSARNAGWDMKVLWWMSGDADVWWAYCPICVEKRATNGSDQ